MATYPCRVVPASAFGPQRPKAFYTAPPAFPAPPPYPTTPSMGYSTASASTTTTTKPPTRPEPPSFASIPDLRDAISSLDSKMASLMRERHALESSLERAVRLQAPIHRIPSEVLSQIYLDGVYADDNPVMIPTLMLVCRHWSEVALETPALWSKISVGPHDSLEKARRKLERSKACPLDITVNFGTRTEYAANVTEQLIHAMDLIRPALWRTRSFSLSVPNRPQAHAALARCQEDAPLLETLCIRIYRSMQDDKYYRTSRPLFNGHTPRLRSCSLTSFNFDWDEKLVSHLSVLKLEGYFNGFAPSAPTLVRILRLCPDLEEFSLRNLSDVESSDACVPMEEPIPPPPPPASKILLPKLKKITFYYAGIALARQVMGHITCPNLEYLELSYLQNITPILQMLHDQALTRLPLRALRIESCLFSEMLFVQLLRRLNSLSTLDLVDIEDASSGFLKSLSSSQPWVCPKLDTLVLDGCTSIEWDALRTFVETRLPANSYPRYHDPASFRPSPFGAYSSASAQANIVRARPTQNHSQAIAPTRLRSIDVTRCHQMSKEMVQWLKMYVAEVKCEPAKGLWGENMPS